MTTTNTIFVVNWLQVYTQLKNVAKKTILRVLAKQAEAEDADQVCCRIKYFFSFLFWTA
jgi:hypothetical protein